MLSTKIDKKKHKNKINTAPKYEAFIITIIVHTSISRFNTYRLRRSLLQ